MKLFSLTKNIYLENNCFNRSEIPFSHCRFFYKRQNGVFFLEDEREISIPLAWFPRLRNASMKQLNHWRFIGKGEGIHWEALDEDISVEKLLNKFYFTQPTKT